MKDGPRGKDRLGLRAREGPVAGDAGLPWREGAGTGGGCAGKGAGRPYRSGGKGDMARPLRRRSLPPPGAGSCPPRRCREGEGAHGMPSGPAGGAPDRARPLDRRRGARRRRVRILPWGVSRPPPVPLHAPYRGGRLPDRPAVTRVWITRWNVRTGWGSGHGSGTGRGKRLPDTARFCRGADPGWPLPEGPRPSREGCHEAILLGLDGRIDLGHDGVPR